ncbi:MAG TPA: hypothetical protein PLE30_02960 [Candidatus Kapabacteria bacterium]|nr:hypothetical protein [Candidatus Kapabacteria bacterium]
MTFNYSFAINKHDKNSLWQVSSHNKKIIERLLSDDIRPIKQSYTISPLNKFIIHYDTLGKDAVDLADVNNNSIPDYIDSVAFYFDYAYTIAIDSLGYKVPPIDSLRGGDNKYDIYIENLVYEDTYVYGYTISEDIFENEYKALSANSYIVIDNNYSPNDSITVNGIRKQAFRTFAIDAVKITSAHEYHHAIQYGYNIQDKDGNLFKEMTSTWLEYYIYPNIFDFTQYVVDLFQNIYDMPITVNGPDNGYRWSIFLQYIAKAIDTKIILNIWEDASKNIDFFTSLENNLKLYNKDIKQVWQDFIPYLYFTSTRTIDSVYFNSSLNFPKLKFIDTKYIESNLKIEKELTPFQIYTARLINSTQVDKEIEAIDIIATYAVNDVDKNIANKINFHFDISTANNLPNKVNYSNSLYYDFTEMSDESEKTILHIFINDGLNYSDKSFAFTNPNNPKNDVLFISLPIESKSNDFDYVVYNMDMQEQYKGKSDSNRYNGFYGVELNNEKLNNGIYYYHIFNKNHNYYGKFTILIK